MRKAYHDGVERDRVLAVGLHVAFGVIGGNPHVPLCGVRLVLILRLLPGDLQTIGHLLVLPATGVNKSAGHLRMIMGTQHYE